MQINEHPGAVSQFEASVVMPAFCWLSILGIGGKGVVEGVVTLAYGRCKSCEGHQNGESGSPGSLLSFPRLEPKATFIGSSPRPKHVMDPQRRLAGH